MARNINMWAVGWSAFAAMIMMIVGLVQAFTGLVAIVNGEFYVVSRGWLLELDVTAWGWIHLILGVTVFSASIGLLMGKTWARIVGIAGAVVSAVGSFAFLPYYPFWSVILIALAVAVIWSLTAHGDELAHVMGND
jgi:hypothetical protein